MKTNRAGIDLIKVFEGCRLSAYLDTAGVPTIGVGHTGPEVHIGLTWTQAQADERLAADLAKFEAGVARVVTRQDITANQFSALVSFAYNEGVGALQGSTLLHRFNAGQTQGAADEFLKWKFDHEDGQLVESAGLLRRREAERALFLTP